MKRILFSIIDFSFTCALITGFLVGAWNILAPDTLCWIDTAISFLIWFISTLFILVACFGFYIQHKEKQKISKTKNKFRVTKL